jgi:hypothetical protein
MLVRQLSIAAIFVVNPLGWREQEQPKRILRKTQHGKATADIFEG